MAGIARTTNLSEEKVGYLRIAYEFLEEFEKLSLATLFSLSKIFSFSSGKKDSQACCHSKMSDFSKDLNITERHSSRVIKKCIEMGYIERLTDEDEKVIKSWYKYTGTKELKKGYIRIDIANLYREFQFKADKEHKEAYKRRLTLAEILVLSYMITHADNVKKKSGTFSGSYRSIARKLHISPTTVRKAILSLMKTGLISLPEEDKGVNGSGWSKYHVDKSLLRRTQEEELERFKKSFTQAKKPMENSVPKPNESTSYDSKPEYQKRIDDANARAERDRYYSKLQERAKQRAEKFEEFAEGNTRFKEVKKELSRMEIQLAQAELFNKEEFPALLRRKKELQKERRLILDKLGINEIDLKPIYRCQKCSDKGFKEDGTACDCYPGITKSVGVGKLDT